MKIPDQDFTLILQFIEAETGIALPDTNYRNTGHFVSGKLLAYNLDTNGYLQLLKNNREEYDEFLNVITINETYFFREEKHFTLLDTHILPGIYNLEANEVNIWSAACSTGEEALSLAVLLHKHANGLYGKTCTVYATDINPVVLAFFRKGCYTKNSFREDGAGYRHLLKRAGTEQDGTWQPGEELKRGIRILRTNLYTGQFDHLPEKFQIIFIRNTLLYMRMDTRLWIIDQLVKRLGDDGCLFLSVSETALISHPALVLEEKDNVYFFRKKSGIMQKQEQIPAVTAPGKTIKDEIVIRTGMSSRKDKPALTVNDVAVIINARANNSLFNDNHDLKVQAALEIDAIIKLINAGSFDLAGEKLKKLEAGISPNELVYYLYGYTDMLAGNTGAALAWFRKALLLNNSFWPARFYLARLLAAGFPDLARKEFLVCRKYLEHYIESGNRSLQFLLENFNAGYFKAVCDKWLAGTQGGYRDDA